MNILIADDDPLIVRLVTRVLEGPEYRILTAQNGTEAREILRREGPPLVLLDWIMPEPDGLALCREIRTSEAYGFTYVIMLTGRSEKAQIVEALDAGADDYITKPFDMHELLARVRAAERLIRLEGEYRRSVVQLHKANAQVAVLNSRLQRMSHSLEHSQAEALRAAQVAETASQAKSEFLANMSHEIRSPLTAILGYVELLQTEGDIDRAPPERREALEAISRNASHLLQIINDILDLSKIEAGKLTFFYQSFDARFFFKQTIRMMRGRLSQEVALKLDIDPSVPEQIVSDPVRVRQILINLLGNAIKFTPSGEIRVSVFTEPADSGILVIEVRDTGIGMTEDEGARLFEPFVQADGSLTRAHGGTGLGLTICRRLARHLGGDVVLQETRLGKGTCFLVTIRIDQPADGEPLAPAPSSGRAAVPEAGSSQPSSERPPSDSDRPRLLLVEDGPDTRRLLVRFLEKLPADVTTAENGKEGVEAVRRAVREGTPFDLILMDMQMPVMDGYTAARTLREEGIETPILALTAQALSGDREKCLAAGCTDYLSKPVTRADLLERVRALLPETAPVPVEQSA